MINQKAREIAVDAMWVPSWADGEAKDVIRGIYMSGERDDEHSVKAAHLGIIEGRRQAFEEAAKVADAWEKRAVSQLGDKRNKEAWSGEAQGAREIAAAIRSLK